MTEKKYVPLQSKIRLLNMFKKSVKIYNVQQVLNSDFLADKIKLENNKFTNKETI